MFCFKERSFAEPKPEEGADLAVEDAGYMGDHQGDDAGDLRCLVDYDQQEGEGKKAQGEEPGEGQAASDEAVGDHSGATEQQEDKIRGADKVTRKVDQVDAASADAGEQQAQAVPQEFKVAAEPADALLFEAMAVADLFIIEQGVPGKDNAIHMLHEAELELFVEAAGPASLVIADGGEEGFEDGNATTRDGGGKTKEGTHMPISKIHEGGAPVVDAGIYAAFVLGSHVAADGAAAAVVPGVENLEEIRMGEVVRVEDDQHFVPGREMAEAEVEGGHLIVEGSRRLENVDTGIAESEEARVAVVRDYVYIKPGVCLPEEGVDDGRNEFGLPVGGNDDAELKLPGDLVERGAWRPDAE
jgi:hypothetical protein